MNIVFISPDEPFYLPEFYNHLLSNISLNKYNVKVIIVPPVYKNTTKLDLIIKYTKTFGVNEAINLAVKTMYFKIMDIIIGSKGEKFFSLRSVFDKYSIPFIYETDVNSERNLSRLKDWKTDLIISISCPQIFKKPLINLPPKGCLNLHGSLLPDYRGVMPSFWVLANNEKEAGITLFFVNEKIDAGDVIIQRKYTIDKEDTLDSVIRKSKKIGAEMVIEAIKKIERGDVKTYPLDMTKGRYFGWPSREDVKRFLKNGRKFR